MSRFNKDGGESTQGGEMVELKGKVRLGLV